MNPSDPKRLFQPADSALTTDQWYDRLAAMEEWRLAFVRDLQQLEKILSGIDPAEYCHLPAMLAEWPEALRLSTADTAEFYELPKVAALLRANQNRSGEVNP